ncbi:MAG: DUF302 domain-containing protein [Chlorobi bacterium]|nr:DUF302 domain-containing protein [Chlorobiota bacterium]
MKYFINKELKTGFEESISKVKDSLMNQGFGVITEVMMHEKLKEKLNVDYNKYVILGACNPALAYEALKQEVNIGTMLPCNVIVREKEENVMEVVAIDPVPTMDVVENDELKKIAIKVKEKLELALSEL